MGCLFFPLDWAEIQAILSSWNGRILEYLYFLKAGERPSDYTTFPGIRSFMAALLINLCVISGSFLRGLINMCESLIITTPQHFQHHFSSETSILSLFLDFALNVWEFWMELWWLHFLLSQELSHWWDTQDLILPSFCSFLCWRSISDLSYVETIWLEVTWGLCFHSCVKGVL